MTLTELIDKSFGKGFDISIKADRSSREVEFRISRGDQIVSQIIPFEVAFDLRAIDIFAISFDKMADILDIKNDSVINKAKEKAYWMIRSNRSIGSDKLETRARCSKCDHIYPRDWHIGMDLPPVCPQCHSDMCAVPSEH